MQRIGKQARASPYCCDSKLDGGYNEHPGRRYLHGSQPYLVSIEIGVYFPMLMTMCMPMVIMLAVVVVVFTVLMVLVHNQIPFRSARIVATFALPIRLINT